MANALSLQSVLLKLQEFWAEQGCVIWQPHHSEVGAGTMNPATILRVLGPEPWRVGYVEPSIRPTDGRFGENPNRWQHYYQFQVILKPDPGNPQEIYLKSLEALGVNPAEHDIRFVEDNWESPALGAWGLGWEVWLDGQEISQYTYFQQAGGITLDPVAVEITYGIERIVMALQGARTFLEIAWNEDYTYGDLALESERQHCIYNFEAADIERLRGLYEQYHAEARAAIDARLPFPAHDYVLRCSHTFNVLDARGAVGVTERATLFGQMRDLARQVARIYLEQREEAGFPWLKKFPPPAPQAAQIAAVKPLTAKAPFVLEIGTEELPAADFETAREQLQAGIQRLLEESRLAHGAVQLLGTPRRLALLIEDLAPAQQEQLLIIKGPPAERSFDAEGNPTPAAIGFARSKGLEVSALRVETNASGSYAVAEVRQAGRTSIEVLSEKLPDLIASLRFERSMRWDASGVQFSRPIRWLLAIHGDQVVPFSYAGLQSGSCTRSRRFTSPEAIDISAAADYLPALEGVGILPDVAQRRQAIWQQVTALAAEVGGTVIGEEDLLDEVTRLVEAPTALRGSFDPAYLKLPREVLISVMKKHQRYFPVEQDGRLLPYFIAVRNGDARHLDSVTHGNEQVILARFADAAHFVELDQRQPLESYLPRLETMAVAARLGSMLDRVHRLEKLVPQIAAILRLSDAEGKVAERAARICKADLGTRMVVEMTSLQGEVGRHYALAAGEPAAVAEAIAEHYRPRFAGDALPQSPAGISVAIADRLDSLMGLFAVGLQPSGTKDPFALRRAAIGLVQILAGHQLSFDLRQGLRLAGEHLPLEYGEQELEACLHFIRGREQAQLLADGHPFDVVEAVMAAQGDNPATAARAVEELQARVRAENWSPLLQAFARCARITRGQEEVFTVEDQRLSEATEVQLLAELQAAEAKERRPGSVADFLAVFEPLVPTITRFFEDVMVMDEDLAIRRSRLGLLQRIVALAAGVADLSRLEGF